MLGPKTRVAGGSFDSASADAVSKLAEGSRTDLSGTADVIPPHAAGTYVISSAGVDAMTLAAPTAGDLSVGGDDFIEILLVSQRASAHTVTATGLFQDGAGHVNTATFAAQLGANIRLMALAGKWIVLSANGVTVA